jgi:hypothetical protein
MAFYSEAILKASAAVTTTANGATTDTIAQKHNVNPNARAFIDCTASAGTDNPTCIVKIQGIVGGQSYDLGTFTTITGTTKETIALTNVPEMLRAVWAITGTNPSFTFSVRIARF